MKKGKVTDYLTGTLVKNREKSFGVNFCRLAASQSVALSDAKNIDYLIIFGGGTVHNKNTTSNQALTF